MEGIVRTTRLDGKLAELVLFSAIEPVLAPADSHSVALAITEKLGMDVDCVSLLDERRHDGWSRWSVVRSRWYRRGLL